MRERWSEADGYSPRQNLCCGVLLPRRGVIGLCSTGRCAEYRDAWTQVHVFLCSSTQVHSLLWQSSETTGRVAVASLRQSGTVTISRRFFALSAKKRHSTRVVPCCRRQTPRSS